MKQVPKKAALAFELSFRILGGNIYQKRKCPWNDIILSF
jgi:hypothetical protein